MTRPRKGILGREIRPGRLKQFGSYGRQNLLSRQSRARHGPVARSRGRAPGRAPRALQKPTVPSPTPVAATTTGRGGTCSVSGSAHSRTRSQCQTKPWPREEFAPARIPRQTIWCAARRRVRRCRVDPCQAPHDLAGPHPHARELSMISLGSGHVPRSRWIDRRLLSRQARRAGIPGPILRAAMTEWQSLSVDPRTDGALTGLDELREPLARCGYRLTRNTRAGIIHVRITLLTEPRPARLPKARRRLPPLPAGAQCGWCPHPASGWDHLEAESHGGSSEPINLLPCCQPCNSRRQCTTPAEFAARPRCVICGRHVFAVALGCASAQACADAALDPVWEFVPSPMGRGGQWTRRDDPRRRVYDTAGQPTTRSLLSPTDRSDG